MPIETLPDYEEYLTSKGIEPYKEVISTPEKSTPSQKEKFTDTNTPEHRVLRIKNQRELENNLEVMNGQSLIERITCIREKVFGENDVRGDLATKIRERAVGAGKGTSEFYYPEEVRMAEKYFPALIKFVDVLYDQITKIPKLSEEQTLRFCAVVYNMGILVHPYADGNGQTFRIAAESYLHELSEESKDKYFPFKTMHNKETHITSIQPSSLDYSPLASDLSPFEGLITAQEFLKTAPTHDRESPPSRKYEEWLNRLGKALNVSNVTSENYEELLSEKIINEAEKLVSLGIEKEVVERFVDSQRASRRQGAIHGYLDYSLFDEDFINTHVEYVKSGELRSKTGSSREIALYTHMASQTYYRTFNQMRYALQSKNEHEKSLSSAISSL